MSSFEQAFPTRVFSLEEDAGVSGASGRTDAVRPDRINQHIEGIPNGTRTMTDEEVARLLNDPFAELVLRAGKFPRGLGELLEAFDEHNASSSGLPEQSTFLVSEGGQIRFAQGLNKGGSRLITVRSRRMSPEVTISTLIPPGVSPRAENVLNEVFAWDSINRTFHFYQRQQGAWFWCGQSDMALEESTQGKGPFDSHVSGYPLMKELRSPWVHWHGPSLRITEIAYAPGDPLVSDPLFADRQTADQFEKVVIVQLIERWNTARFEKARQGKNLTAVRRFMAQLLQAPSANLISTHAQWSKLPEQDLADLPPTFFYDQDSLAAAGVTLMPPRLSMAGGRYSALAEKYDLRVQGGTVDQPGDVPFCFTVPERAFEDVVVVRGLIQQGAMSERLAACLLMIDFSNPLRSLGRDALMPHVPDAIGLTPDTNLDAVLIPSLLRVAEDAPNASPERKFAAHWELGPTRWKTEFAKRISDYLGRIKAKLESDAGCDEIFRLAESRRREFSQRPLSEFGLTLPQSVGIPSTSPPLEMTEEATVRKRTVETQA